MEGDDCSAPPVTNLNDHVPVLASKQNKLLSSANGNKVGAILVLFLVTAKAARAHCFGRIGRILSLHSTRDEHAVVLCGTTEHARLALPTTLSPPGCRCSQKMTQQLKHKATQTLDINSYLSQCTRNHCLRVRGSCSPAEKHDIEPLAHYTGQARSRTDSRIASIIVSS
jgi:hypothetical protein